MESFFIFVEKLDFNVVENEKLGGFYKEIVVADWTQEGIFWFFLFIIVVKYASPANNLEVWDKAALFELRNGDHPDFENLLDHSGHSKSRQL